MKQKIGQVTEEEKKEIQLLFERKNGLAELAKIIKNDDALYDKMVTDMGATAVKFQNWWEQKAEKYQWETRAGGNWEINFESNEIYLA
jgi:CXXX repeat modification system protein